MSSNDLDKAIAELAANLNTPRRHGRIKPADVNAVRKAQQTVAAIPLERVRQTMEAVLVGQIRAVLDEDLRGYLGPWRAYVRTIDRAIEGKIHQLFAKDAFDGDHAALRGLLAAGYRAERPLSNLLEYMNHRFLQAFDEDGDSDFRAIQTFLDCGVEITPDMMKTVKESRARAMLEAEILRRAVPAPAAARIARGVVL